MPPAQTGGTPHRQRGGLLLGRRARTMASQKGSIGEGMQTKRVSPTPSRNRARSPVQPRWPATVKKNPPTPSGSGRRHPTGPPQSPGPLASRPFPGAPPAQSGA
eukprot:6325477-Pyramimonas_sp.AAC.1